MEGNSGCQGERTGPPLISWGSQGQWLSCPSLSFPSCGLGIIPPIIPSGN